MSPIQIRHAFAGLGMLAALAPVIPAQAATINYNNGNSAMSFTDATCTNGFVLSGNTLSCGSDGGTQPTTPTGCLPTLSTLPNPLPSTGGTVNLNVTNCSPATGLTYTWTKNTQSFKFSQSAQDTLLTNSSTTQQTWYYQVQVCNGTACTTPLPATPLPAVVPGKADDGGTGSISCPGFNSVIVVDLDWLPRKLQSTKTVSTFGNGDIVIARFTTPAGLLSNGAYGRLSAAEYAGSGLGASADRTAVLSTTPCDFNTNADSTHAQYTNRGLGTAVSVNFTRSIIEGGVVLQPGKTYYFNIKNELDGTPTCGAPNCPIAVSLFPN